MIFRWVIGVLVVWRLTHLLNSEDGPGEIFLKTRQRAGNGWPGQLLGCFMCLSLWVALPAAWLISNSWKQRTLFWPALSAGAILLEHAFSRSDSPPPAVYFEDEES
jgi:hypothetical protein